ncbi:PAS domain S-box protein [Pseudoduganella sp. UC29_106]|uniref:PAS domain S-box protein n=1 Tax=Pseudoduganella sp. UC29_106 TaxID=3374553 RepID=UPI0037580D02
MVQSHVANFAPDRTVSAESLRLVELIPCAALLYSDAEAILAANRMFCELLGYTQAELARLGLADFTDGEDRQRGDDARAQFLQNAAGEVSFRQRYRRKDGEGIACEVALECIADAQPVQYLAVVRQLSIQHPREAGQLASDDELILKSVAEGFVVLDREFRVLRINDEALRIDGRPRSAFLGRTYWEIWPGSEDLLLADAYRRAMRDRVELTVEQLYRHNGRELWIKARATPLRDGLLVFYRNITGRKRAEEELRESEARFRTIADSMPQIVWSTQPDGYDDYFNRQWHEYTGVPEGAAHGDAWVNLFHPDDVAQMEQRWGHSLATGEPYEAEFRLRHRSGNYRWWLARALPVRNEHGEIVRWMGTSTDIHERILMQAELQDIQVRLQAALNAAEIGTWTWDIAADQVHADSNLAAMFGISPAVADGGPIDAYYAVIHPDDVAAVRGGIDKALGLRRAILRAIPGVRWGGARPFHARPRHRVQRRRREAAANVRRRARCHPPAAGRKRAEVQRADLSHAGGQYPATSLDGRRGRLHFLVQQPLV